MEPIQLKIKDVENVRLHFPYTRMSVWVPYHDHFQVVHYFKIAF